MSEDGLRALRKQTHVEIESASVDDALGIAEVHVSTFRATYQGLLPEPVAHRVVDAQNVTKRTQGWRKWLARSRVSTFIARIDEAVIGFCTMQPIRDEPAEDELAADVVGEISAFYVLPSYWRHGIGRLLGERMLAEAEARGFGEVVLWVLESNERARRFYDALGFGPDGERRVFIEHSETSVHELRYRRSI